MCDPFCNNTANPIQTDSHLAADLSELEGNGLEGDLFGDAAAQQPDIHLLGPRLAGICTAGPHLVLGPGDAVALEVAVGETVDGLFPAVLGARLPDGKI